MNTLDIAITAGAAILGVGFLYIVWSYARGLRDSPRELFLLFFSQIMEYIAYGSMSLCFVLFLSSDVGLSDIGAGTYIGVYSTTLTLITMLVGAIADAIGIKKTLLVGTFFLLLARLVLPFSANIYLITLLGFFPLAVGTALLSPVLSVSIKKFTKPETAAMGFGLFYTLMNVGYAIGGWMFDAIRIGMGDKGKLNLLPGMAISTYQVIFGVGFFFTLLNLGALWMMREGKEMTPASDAPATPAPKQVPAEKGMKAVGSLMKTAALDSVRILKNVISERPFWVYLFMLGLLIFVRLTFYHFHYTFPKYGIRVLGPEIKIGAIYGVLNPVLIVFLTPLIAALTRKLKSYTVLFWGTLISSSAVFLASMPAKFWEPLMGTWFSELIFDRWLGVSGAHQTPIILGIVMMVIVFTIGEAIWSPRLMHFTAEIAPKGKEGSYIALSYLPFFGAKLLVGPLSGWLVATYTPEGASSYPNHHMVWYWVGGMALLTPVGLVAFRKLFRRSEFQSQAERSATADTGTSDLQEQEA